MLEQALIEMATAENLTPDQRKTAEKALRLYEQVDSLAAGFAFLSLDHDEAWIRSKCNEG